MNNPSHPLRFTSAGFWLPCYHSSFFSPRDDTEVLQSFATVDLDLKHLFPKDKLDVTIFSRLLMVLPDKGFTEAYPILPPAEYLAHHTAEPGPLYMLFFANLARLTQDARDAQRVQEAYHQKGQQVSTQSMYGVHEPHEPQKEHGCPGFANVPGAEYLALVVSHEGFYVWTLAYRETYAEADMQKALKEHIYQIVGGAYASHQRDSITPTGTAKEGNISEQAASQSLTLYRDKRLGMLTFFQINTILEGMYNMNLDPRVFFRSAENIEREYSLGGFITEITASVEPANYSYPAKKTKNTPDSTPTHPLPRLVSKKPAENIFIDFFNAYFNASSGTMTRDKAKLEMGRRFANQCLNPEVQGHILDEFLRKTEVITLKQLKKRVERCRRALLEELIEVTHRRDPLIQAEPPDSGFDRIDEVTEAQLRGYVMLISAKLPLIANVALHLEDLHYAGKAGKRKKKSARPKISLGDTGLEPPVAKAEVAWPLHSWNNLLKGIQYDVASLIDAINQARTDRMLYEQEQIHAEQETITEIERLKKRSENAISSDTNVTISVISNIIAILAVLFGLLPLYQHGVFTLDLQQILNNIHANGFGGIVGPFVILVGVVVGYLAVQFFTLQVVNWIVRLIKRDLRRDAKFYYEMDLHIDAPFKLDQVEYLFEGMKETALHATPLWRRTARQPKLFVQNVVTLGNNFYHSIRHFFNRPDPRNNHVKNVERNSYRVERQERSEALHKIYLDADIRVSDYRHVPATLVYELLYHRPAKDHDYIFKDLRVIANHADELTAREVRRLKYLIAEKFVNPFIADKEVQPPGWHLELPQEKMGSDYSADGYDSLFTVTQYSLVKLKIHDLLGRRKTYEEKLIKQFALLEPDGNTYSQQQPPPLKRYFAKLNLQRYVVQNMLLSAEKGEQPQTINYRNFDTQEDQDYLALRQKLSWSDIAEGNSHVIDLIKRKVERFSDADLSSSQKYPWNGGKSLLEVIVDIFADYPTEKLAETYDMSSNGWGERVMVVCQDNAKTILDVFGTSPFYDTARYLVGRSYVLQGKQRKAIKLLRPLFLHHPELLTRWKEDTFVARFRGEPAYQNMETKIKQSHQHEEQQQRAASSQ